MNDPLCTICLKPMRATDETTRPKDGPLYHTACLEKYDNQPEPITQTMNQGLQHKERLLRKVKLNNDGGASIHWIDIYYNPDENRYIKNKDDRTCDAKVHDDLKAALQPFAEHFAIRCDQTKVKGNYPFDGTAKGAEKCSISSVTFSGGVPDPENDEDGDALAAHITCYVKWEGGQGATWCSPGIKPTAPNEKYKHTSELDQHIAALEAEAWAYLDGKVAPVPVDPQQAMRFDAEGNPIADADETNTSVNAIGAAADDDDDPTEDVRRIAQAAANTTPVDK